MGYIAPTDCMMQPRAPIPSSGRQVVKIESGVDDGAQLFVRYSDGWAEAVVEEL
jgi:hypothetical protein